MAERDRDTSYTLLCDVITRMGEQRAPLFGAMLSPSLTGRQAIAGDVLALTARAEKNPAE